MHNTAQLADRDCFFMQNLQESEQNRIRQNDFDYKYMKEIKNTSKATFDFCFFMSLNTVNLLKTWPIEII